MRISPPGFTITKVCTEETELINFDGKPITIEKGTSVHIPNYSIYNDLNYYPNPDEFDPERFDESQCSDLKTLRDEGLFFPFGHGPRMCLGMRYSTLLIKMAILEVVRNFEITIDSRTKDLLIVEPKNVFFFPVHNVFLNYEPIRI